MPQVTEAAVMTALGTVQEPELGGDLVTRNMVRDLKIDGSAVAFTIELTTPACPLKDEIESRVHAALDPIGVESVELTWGASVRRATPRTAEQLLPGVKNVIAVASGKGGVGKSTDRRQPRGRAGPGRRVRRASSMPTSPGPNVPIMLGLDGQPGKSKDEKILPLERHGVKAISIQFFVPAGQPIIWRGPLVGGAIQQFLRDVEWGELDYLVIDLPPGTSDAQLTLAQAVPISGSVLVTTPQEVALLDVEKALAMFKRMSVPVIGIVENMSGLVCPHCGEIIDLFGRGGGERFARENGIEFLGGIPLDVTVRQGGDVGVPAVAQREPGPAAACPDQPRQDRGRPDERSRRHRRRTAAPDRLLGARRQGHLARNLDDRRRSRLHVDRRVGQGGDHEAAYRRAGLEDPIAVLDRVVDEDSARDARPHHVVDRLLGREVAALDVVVLARLQGRFEDEQLRTARQVDDGRPRDPCPRRRRRAPRCRQRSTSTRPVRSGPSDAG